MLLEKTVLLERSVLLVNPVSLRLLIVLCACSVIVAALEPWSYCYHRSPELIREDSLDEYNEA